MVAKEWDEEVERQNLIDAYEAFYVTGFRSNDVGLIDQIVQYPLTYIKDGKTRVVEYFPIDPARLKSDLGWDHSKDWSFEVLAIGMEQAHVTAMRLARTSPGLGFAETVRRATIKNASTGSLMSRFSIIWRCSNPVLVLLN